MGTMQRGGNEDHTLQKAEDLSKKFPEPVKEAVETAGEAGKKAPRLFGLPTGVEGLDELFFTVEIKNGKPVKKPLGGYPYQGVINLTGIADTGKSLMAEQFAVSQASKGHKTAFVTVESPAAFVASGLKARAMAMGIDWEKVDRNVILIDAASKAVLREDIPVLLSTIAYVIKTFETTSVVIDSVTGLYEAKEMMARSVVRQIFNFLKKWKQTGLLVSQKRSGHEEMSAEAAGGYAVAHIVDCSIVLAKVNVTSRAQSSLYKAPLGETVRLLRIDGCRLCGHDSRTHLMEITETGLVKVGPPLGEQSS